VVGWLTSFLLLAHHNSHSKNV